MLPEAWREPNISHPHNWVLDFWIQMGVLGLVAGTALILSDLQTKGAGNYTVVVANPAGSVTSIVAALTVAVLSNPSLWETSNIGAVWSDDQDAIDEGWMKEALTSMQDDAVVRSSKR